MLAHAAPNVSEDKTKELLFEYDQLRKEILGNFNLGLQILGGTVTFVAVIMTFGFSQAVQSNLAKAALFFVGETVAFIGLIQTMSLAHSTFQIASYLRIFTEAELSYVKWETRLHLFRDKLSGLPYEELTGSMRYTYAFIIIVNYLLASSYALWNVVPDFQFKGIGDLPRFIWEGFKGSPATGLLLGLALIVTVYLLVIAWRQYQVFVVQHDITFSSRWNKIKSDEG